MSLYKQEVLDAMFVRQLCRTHNLRLDRTSMGDFDPSAQQFITIQADSISDELYALDWEYWAPAQ